LIISFTWSIDDEGSTSNVIVLLVNGLTKIVKYRPTRQSALLPALGSAPKSAPGPALQPALGSAPRSAPAAALWPAALDTAPAEQVDAAVVAAAEAAAAAATVDAAAVVAKAVVAAEGPALGPTQWWC